MANIEQRPYRIEIPAIENRLLRPEHVSYLMGWHKILGDQKKVVYNAMGPDISTILLLTNPDLIIGIDPEQDYTDSSLEYVNDLWPSLDKIPVLKADGFENVSVLGIAEEDDRYKQRRFQADLKFRRDNGYWDITHITRWQIDRLQLLELKKLGVKPETIKINTEDYSKTTVSFDWAYPGESVRRRTLNYHRTTIDYVTQEKDMNGMFNKINFYYQKSLPESNYSCIYLQKIKRYLKGKGIIALGHKFIDFEHMIGDRNQTNNEFQSEIQFALGDDFKPLTPNPKLDKIIDDLSDPVEDDGYGMNAYGMKLHVFKKS